MSKSSQNHPYYTFMPVQHHPLRQALIEPTAQFLKAVCAFLEEKHAYGNLVLDQRALELISCYFTSQDLTQLRVLTKELITQNREKQRDMFAIYILEPTKANFEQMAKDFGGAPVKSFEEVRKIRDRAVCCQQPNRYYNPYSYRGMFLGVLSGDLQAVQQRLRATNLSAICSETRVLNLICTVPRRRFADFGVNDGFKRILQGKTADYEKIMAEKLKIVFQALQLNPVVRFQKNSKICQNIFQQLSFTPGTENAQLILLDRTVDCLTPLALPQTFSAVFDELRAGAEQLTIKYDKAGQKDSVESVSVDCREVREIGQFGIVEGINQIYKGFNDYKALRAGTESFSDKEYGSLRVQKLKPNEELMMQGQILRLNNTVWNLFKCAKFVDNKMHVLQNFHFIQCLLFQTAQTGNFAQLYKQEVPGTKMTAVDYLISVGRDFPYEVARILVLAGVIVQQQTSVLSKEAEAILQKLNDSSLFAKDVPLDPRDINFFKCYSLFSRQCQSMQQLLVSKFGKESVPTPISAMEIIVDSILHKRDVENQILQPQHKLSFNPFLAKAAWDENQELQVSKSRIIMEEDNNLQEYDQQMFRDKYKVFIFMAGGMTPAEICAVTRMLEKDWGRIGVFNKGIEKEWDVDFYMLSDCEMAGRAYFDAVCDALQ